MSASVPLSTVVGQDASEASRRHGGIPARPSRLQPQPLSVLASLIGASLARPGPTELMVTGVSSGSGEVVNGDLFAALPGSTGHGIRYASEAIAAGARAILTDPAGAHELESVSPSLSAPTLVTPDPRAVLGAVAAEVYGHPSRSMAVYGVTGTSGKTTTTFLVRAGLAAASTASGLIGTVGIFVGTDMVTTSFTTPEAPQLQALLAVMLERGVRGVAMEVSSHALRLGRVDGVEFAVGAFTNLSQDHLDFHADMEDYFAAKSLLFDGRAQREIVVIDDEWGRRLIGPNTITVSTQYGGHWRADRIRVLGDGSTRFTATGGGVSFEASCRIPGRYNVSNTMLAFAILAEAGVDVRAVAPAVGSAQVPGRMQRIDGDQPFLTVVDYSHKPAGVAGALQALRPLTSGRLIIVLGCGGDRDRGKRPVMGDLAARQSDVLIVTDDNPRTEDPAGIRAVMLSGARAVPAAESAEIIEEGDRRAAILRAVTMARPADTVLVAGKGHETGQYIGGAMLPFDDVTVVREALVSQGFCPSEDAMRPPTAAPNGDVTRS
jgi:UDP-N-acetylmuramoyl-L-alanyl-D-glutamate--2,6-diaminopimelate ligase